MTRCKPRQPRSCLISLDDCVSKCWGLLWGRHPREILGSWSNSIGCLKPAVRTSTVVAHIPRSSRTLEITGGSRLKSPLACWPSAGQFNTLFLFSSEAIRISLLMSCRAAMTLPGCCQPSLPPPLSRSMPSSPPSRLHCADCCAAAAWHCGAGLNAAIPQWKGAPGGAARSAQPPLAPARAPRRCLTWPAG